MAEEKEFDWEGFQQFLTVLMRVLGWLIRSGIIKVSQARKALAHFADEDMTA